MGMVSEPAPTYRDIACAEAIASNMQIFDLENNQTNPEREEYNSIHLGHLKNDAKTLHYGLLGKK